MTSFVCKEIAHICLKNVLIPMFNEFFLYKTIIYTDQYLTYYYMMSANWVSVKIMVPSECRPTEFLPTARPQYFHIVTFSMFRREASSKNC